MSESEAIWKRPAWLTAIAGVISVCLTVPTLVGDFLKAQQELTLTQLEKEQELKLTQLEKEQQIALAELRVKAAEEENKAAKQSREYEIIDNTLARQGPERIFMLRYFAATLEDESAKSWAADEVTRLDKIVTLRTDLETEQIANQSMSKEINELNEKISGLAAEVGANKKVEKLRAKVRLLEDQLSDGSQVSTMIASALNNAQQQAGLSVPDGPTLRYVEFDNGAGTIRQIDDNTWVENNYATSSTYSYNEVGRDEWSVYLEDSEREVMLQLDVFRNMITYRKGSGPLRDLYRITRAR